jgi:hypothetical protein
MHAGCKVDLCSLAGYAVYTGKHVIWVLLQAAADKKAAALQVEREARRAAEARATEAEAARQADGRLRRAAEKNVRALAPPPVVQQPDPA